MGFNGMKLSKKTIAVSTALSAVLMALLALGYADNGISENAVFKLFPSPMAAFVVATILGFLVLALLLASLLDALPRFVRDREVVTDKPWRHFALRFDRKSILQASLLVFACWIPWIILQLPCTMNFDTCNQLFQFMTDGPTYYTTVGYYVDAQYIDHHPVFDTLLYGCFIWIGNLVGSQNAGLFLFSLLQCALTAIALAASCCYLERLNAPKAVRVGAILFVALFPAIPQWATCMVKDSTYSLFFIPYFIMYLEVLRTKGEAWRSRRFLIWFIVVIGLCILSKKTGVHIVTISGLFLLLANRGTWKQGLTVLIAPILVFSLALPAAVYPAIGGVAPGGKQEAIGSLLQQTVTVLRQEGNNVTADERAAIDAVLDTQSAMLN